MAVRPLYNGTARAATDNNLGGGLLNEFCIRAQVGAAPETGSDAISNTTFEAKAGTSLTIHYDVRKFGSGLEADTPTEGRVFIFNADDSNDATTGFVLESGDVISGAVLPRTGSFTFTPTLSGTYRIACWMRRFGTPATKDWSVHSDGASLFGALADQRRAIFQDKGRLRFGHDLTSLTVTERGNAPPSKFAATMNATQTALQEAVRIDSVQSHSQNKTVAGVNIYRFRQRRNGTSTMDVDGSSTILTATTQRTETLVTRISYPNEGVNQLYDIVATIAELGALHTNNTPQYSGLGGQAADGIWIYFTGVGSGLTLTDYKTVTKLATHNVDAGGSYDNIGAYSAATYTEDGNGVPTGAEKFSYIYTDDNMTVKTLGIKNSRAEVMGGVFIVTECIHEASGQNITTWGNNDTAFKTNTLGNQITARTVVVSTPPSGIYKLTGTAYFPGTSFGLPATREFSVTRIESGSPASASTGKDWIAPASFTTSWLVGEDLIKGGVAKTITIAVYDKQSDGSIIYKNADNIPTVSIQKRNRTTYILSDFASPAVTNIATGQYKFTFTPDVITDHTLRDTYLMTADVTVGSFKRRWAEDVTVLGFDLALESPSPGSIGGGGGGGGVKFISLNEQNKEKKRKKLEDLLGEELSKEEFNSILNGLLDKFNKHGSINGINPASQLSDDEEALLTIILALNANEQS